jgi:hypothetical protein
MTENENENETNQTLIAIDRLTGLPYGYRDDSDAGAEVKMTIEDIRELRRKEIEALGYPLTQIPFGYRDDSDAGGVWDFDSDIQNGS